MSFEMNPYVGLVVILASTAVSLWLMKFRPVQFKQPLPYYVGQGLQMILMLALLGAVVTGLPRELIVQTGPGFVDERTEQLLVVTYFTIGLSSLALFKSIANVVEFVRERSQTKTVEASQ